MGNLTDDMTRLRGEVDALRSARDMLMSDLTRGARDLTAAVAAMRADFTSAHAAMAKQTRGEREAFVIAVSDEVNSLLGKFSQDRNDMAQKGRHDRSTFLSEINRQVAGLCQETANDLLGARLVWRGKSRVKFPAVQEKKETEPVKPVPPPAEPPLNEAAAAPEIKTEEAPVTFMEPLQKEEEKKTVAALQAQEVISPKVKMPSRDFAAPNIPKRKEKSWLDEKPAKTTKKKRGKK